MKYEFKGHIAHIINHTFQVLLVTYLILLLVEQIWTGFVSIYLNLNYLLAVVIIAGILNVFSEHQVKKQHVRNIDYIFIIVLGILGFAILKFKTLELGYLSWIISVIGGILIILLSILVLEEDIPKNNKVTHHTHKSAYQIRINYIKGISVSLIAIVVLSLGLAFFTALGYLESFRIVFGSIYVLFLPGFIISYLFFPKTKEFDSDEDNDEKGSIDWIERIALSFALSIAIVPLTIFYLNLIGIKINLLNSFLIILGILIISLTVLFIKNKRN